MGQTLKTAPQEARRDLSALRIDRDDDNEPRTAGLRYMIIGVLLVAVAGVVAALSYKALNSAARLPEVTVARASIDSGNESYEILTATGYVVAHTKAAVGPKISGKLEYLTVDVGSLVKKNEVIGRLEHHDLDAQLADAKASLANAQASEGQAKAAQSLANATLAQANATEHQTSLDFKRQSELLKDGVASRSDYDNAEAKQKVAVAQVLQAKAQINSANAQLNAAESQIRSADARIREIETSIEYCNIRAPFDGIVISKDADIGEMVAPAIIGGGTTRGSVVTIVDPKTLEVEADVNESNITKITSGLPSIITLDAMPGRKFKADAYQIVPTADRQKATVKVKVKFLEMDPRILPDMSAKVTFLKQPDQAAGGSKEPKISVPKSAIQQRDGKTVVLMLDGEKVRVQPVTTGEDLGDRIDVKQGLVGGETLVVSGSETLKDGDKVRVKS